MGVISQGKVIFCEGNENSLDRSVLSAILGSIPSSNCTIVPVGTKFELARFIQGYFRGASQAQVSYLVFRDRDFDAVPTYDSPRLLQLEGREGQNQPWLSYRACIENYLLNSALIHEYWRSEYQRRLEYPSSQWGHGDSPGVEAIQGWIEDSAKQLRDYQAVRWALGDLLRDPRARRQLKTTWTGKSGVLPQSLELTQCKQAAIEQIIEPFCDRANHISLEHFEARVSYYQSQFSDPAFWERQDYLIWFHGKDLIRQMGCDRNHYISLKAFTKWAPEHLDLQKYLDLVELKDKLAAD